MLRAFRNMTWQHKIIVVAGSAFLAFVVFHLFSLLLRSSPPPRPEALTFSQAPSSMIGFLDPALAVAPDDANAFMALTVLDREQSQSPVLFNTGIAQRSGKGGNAWSMIQTAFQSKRDTLFAPDGSSVLAEGTWRHETPALVYDPGDPGREWKLFVYKYFWTDDVQTNLGLAQRFSVIAYKESANPLNGWGPETWLFAANPNYPPYPYNRLVRLHLNRLHPSLANVASYARPSVIYKQGALLMTLSAFEGEETPSRVILIASTDHGRSWVYLNTLLTQDDARKLRMEHLSGATLAEHKGAVYLLATFGTKSLRNYGVSVMGFDDVARGTLRRDGTTGTPVILSSILPVSDTRDTDWGGGFGAWHDSLQDKTGLLMPEARNGAFTIMRTRKNLLGGD